MNHQSIPPSMDRGQLGRYYVPVSDIKRLGVPALVGAATTIATQSLPAAAAAAAFTSVVALVRRLSGEELEILYVMGKLSATNIYTVWVTADDIVKEMQHELDPAATLRTLAGMRQRGVLFESAGLWRAIW